MNQSFLSPFKRWLAVLLLVVGFAFAANAESVKIGDLYYNLNTTDLTATVTYQNQSSDNYTGLSAQVVIPERVTYNNVSFDVISIANKAFANCTSLESISIPGSVTSVGTTTNASTFLPFYNCTALKNVRFEDGTNSISLGVCYYSESYSGLFSYCPLEEVYIGRNITYVDYSYYHFSSFPERYGYSAFYNQPKLAKVTIGPLCTELTDYLFYKNQAITLMTLPNVKKIGNSTFEECPKLTTLNLGNSLESVGNRAFYNCTNVTKLTFPNTTQSIGNEAFYNCNSVTEVTVGSELKSIGNYGFYGCNSFTALILPDNFTTMGESAFEGCTKLTVAKLGLALTSVPAKAFKNCTSLAEMVVPATSETIGDQAFYNDSGLATITMNEGLKTIGNQVFWNNSGVMQFSIPGTVTSMGTNCFYGCTRTTYLTFRDGTETLEINNTGCRSSIIDAETTNSTYYNRFYDYFYDCPIRFLTLGRNITYSYKDSQSIYDFNGTSFNQTYRASAPFVNSQNLRSVTIGPKVTFLYHHLFDGCINLSTLVMGTNLETIYTYAFKNCDNLKSVTFPESLKLIDNYAFYNCDQLLSMTFEDTSDHTLSIGTNAFEQSSVLEKVTFPGQLKSLGSYSFSNCPKLSETIFNDTNIPDNLLSIYDHSFSKCNALHTVKFPKHLYQIADYVYEYCPTLNELSFPAKLASIGNYVFKNTAFLTDVTFEDSNDILSIGYGAAKTGTDNNDSSMPLFGNANLKSLYLGRNITYNATYNYGYSPFYNQSFLTDVRFSQAGTVTFCNDYLLYKVNDCEKIILPESLTSIGNYTFSGMAILDGITIPNKVTEIGIYAFSDDKGLKYAKLSTSCPWLKEGLFADCDSLESIIIPPIVTKMDTKMFRNCGQLATVTFEDNTDVLEIGYGASQSDYGLFRDCPVETLYLGRWLSYNTDKASRSPFFSITSLKDLTFGEPVGIVDKYMFSYCTGLEEVYLPDNIESVGLWGFRGCTSLKKVRFSEKLSQVSDYGFSECSSLDNVVFPESMTSIADNSFSNCTSLKNLDLGSKLMIIGPAAFKNDTALEGVEIPETLYGLGVEAFANCTSLPNITIKAISSVGKQAFQGCSGLQWVSLSDKTTSLGEDSFKDCTGIKYVKSYAEFPPEGLVNFSDDVVANGTLFVPESSIDYYKYSPTWENWYSIRPISDNILVSSVALDITEYSFKALETVQLTATVGAEDATDKNIIWRSADESIATVNEFGLVTAMSVGDVTIAAIAADGSGVKAECQITVLPTMVESIALSSDVNTLKKGRDLELDATVLPTTATNPKIDWSTSNAAIATVDNNGLVTALTAGNVEIVATASDGSGVSTKFTLSVIPPTKGDSNDNDEVTITDAVNTANYAVGNDVENFCFEAADVNEDNKITLADASGTVTEVLNQSVQSAAMAIHRMTRSNANVEIDNLIIDDYGREVGVNEVIEVKLDNTVDYVALQADITVPDGMTIVDIERGARSEASHSLMKRWIDDNTVRIALFNLDNTPFADNEEAIIRIIGKAKKEVCGDIEMTNIIAADSSANEYVLTSIGGHNQKLSGIGTVYGDGNISIVAIEEGITIYNAEGNSVRIYSVDGTMIADFKATSNAESRKLVKGIYVVTAGNTADKVMVK